MIAFLLTYYVILAVAYGWRIFESGQREGFSPAVAVLGAAVQAAFWPVTLPLGFLFLKW